MEKLSPELSPCSSSHAHMPSPVYLGSCPLSQEPGPSQMLCLCTFAWVQCFLFLVACCISWGALKIMTGPISDQVHQVLQGCCEGPVFLSYPQVALCGFRDLDFSSPMAEVIPLHDYWPLSECQASDEPEHPRLLQIFTTRHWVTSLPFYM